MLANGTVSPTTSLRDYNAWVSQKTYGGNFVTDAAATISNPIPNEGAWFALSNVATYPNSAGAGVNYFGQTSLNDHNFYFRGGTVNTGTGVVTSAGWQKNLSVPASSQTSISIDATQNATFNVADNAALKIKTNNVQRMVIDSIGNVGIGTTTPTSTLQVTGSVANSIVTKTATHTATASEYTIVCNNSGAITINLPAASGASGRVYVIKKISAALNNVTIDPNASETIDGATTKVLTMQYESAMIQSDGTSWYVLANN